MEQDFPIVLGTYFLVAESKQCKEAAVAARLKFQLYSAIASLIAP